MEICRLGHELGVHVQESRVKGLGRREGQHLRCLTSCLGKNKGGGRTEGR